MNISEIMASTIYTITSDKSVSHTAERMDESRVDTLVVMDHGELQGMVTSRDIRSSHPNRIVADAMTKNPPCLSADQDIWDAHAQFTEKEWGQALILEGDRVVGVLTREDLSMKIAEYKDPLTGLYRAPYIQSIGEKLLKERTPFHLLFIDLNEFGKINKLYGHPFGDDVIRAYSKALTSLVEEKRDYVSRYAGDEFVLISTADDHQIEHHIELIEQPTEIHHIQVSAAVGHVHVCQGSDFFASPLRELIAKASMLSSASKRHKAIS